MYQPVHKSITCPVCGEHVYVGSSENQGHVIVHKRDKTAKLICPTMVGRRSPLPLNSSDYKIKVTKEV